MLGACALGFTVPLARLPANFEPAAVEGAREAAIAASLSEHRRYEDVRCLARTAAAPVESATLHLWRDAEGAVNFGDRPPSDEEFSDLSQRELAPDRVRIEIDNRDSALPPHVAAQAVSHAVGVGRVLGEVLGLTAADGLRMRVVFAGSDA